MARSLRPYGKGRFGQMKTRLQLHAQNNLGVIYQDQMSRAKLFRNDNLDKYDKYYEKKQYDDLPEWDDPSPTGEHVPVRKRKPRINYNLAKVIVDKVTSKLAGSQTFPNFVVEEDPEDTEFFRVVQKVAGFRRNLVDPIKHTLLSGSCFVRFFLAGGALEMEWANAKYCYPVFDPVGELEQIEIKYVYEDESDKDARGKFKKKWYRMVLTKTSDTLYDNPEYREGSEPTFTVVDSNKHGLGWVQGEWLRTSKQKFSPDGWSIIGDVLDFLDELNYSLSQTSQAVGYNQDPQLVLKGMDEDEVDKLIRSATKAWNLGRENASAEFIESNLDGVKTAMEQRDHMRHLMLDVVRVVLHDPEKMVGNAQSGKALEVLNAPLVELVDELRTFFEPSLTNLLVKMAMTMLEFSARGMETVLEIAPGYVPESVDISVVWPAIFPLTLEDLNKKATVAQILSTNMIISRESLTRWIAPDLGVDNIDEELQRLEDEPVFNPFTGFGPPSDIADAAADQNAPPDNPPGGKGKPQGK